MKKLLMIILLLAGISYAQVNPFPVRTFWKDSSGVIVSKDYKIIKTQNDFIVNNIIRLGKGAGNFLTNTMVGHMTAPYNVSGESLTLFGQGAGYTITTGDYNAMFGIHAGYFNNGSYNTMLGPHAGGYNLGSYNVLIGYQALHGSEGATGDSVVIIGYNAGVGDTASFSNVYIGHQVGFNSTRYGRRGSVLIGANVGENNTESNILMIDNSSTTTPLIKGNFNTDSLTFNGKTNTTGEVYNGGIRANADTWAFKNVAGDARITYVSSTGVLSLLPQNYISMGSVRPYSNDNINFGLSSSRFGTIYTNNLDLVGTINNDSLITKSEASKIDSATIISLATGVAGWGEVMAGDNEEWASFRFTTAGVVTLITNTTNVSNTAFNPNTLNIYDAGSGVAIQNYLSATQKKVAVNIKYFNP